MVHFPSCEGGRADFKELEKELDKVVAGYKHVYPGATRMFAFGHSFEQGDYPDILDPQRDIVFPPEQEFEVRMCGVCVCCYSEQLPRYPADR